MPSRNWADWHRHYDDPGSSLARRLAVVQQCLRQALDTAGSRELRLISMCAGEGSDVLPVLAERPRTGHVRAHLVELDPLLAQRARAAANTLGLNRVRISAADAGITDAYAGDVPAHIVLACGVFGNISHHDLHHTISLFPMLTAAGGTVIWTRGRHQDDPTPEIRRWFAQHGFVELAFHAPHDAYFSVGMNQLAEDSGHDYQHGLRMFTFT